MKFHRRMNVLLVFAKDDPQGAALAKAAERGNYSCETSCTADAALQSFLRLCPQLVFIDNRFPPSLDAKALCRSMRAASAKCQTTFVAVMAAGSIDKAELLLNAGFTRRFYESTNVEHCFNELLSMEQGEVKLRQQLTVCSALVSALQNIQEAVEILDKHFKTEFVNCAFERMTGYQAKELVGKDNVNRLICDNGNGGDDVKAHFKAAKMWTGTQCIKKKNGEVTNCKCKLTPLETTNGCPDRYLVVRWFAQESFQWEKIREVEHTHNEFHFRHGSFISLSSTGEVNGVHYRRKESRFHSKTTVETPITKVINIINDAQASSPSLNVVQALDRVLEILQSSDLFSTQIQRVNEEEDPITSDLVGALVEAIPGQQYPGFPSANKSPISATRSEALNDVQALAVFPPEVQKLLKDEMAWTFDIIQLEKITNKQPLTCLGLKVFQRFKVCQFLGIDERTLANWFRRVQAAYHVTNTYHTATHAADVMQATAYFLEHIRPKGILDQGDEVAALIAAVLHDVDHPGKTSSFLVNARDPLAILYNDMSVLENHHAAYGFKITLEDERVNIFKNLAREEYESMRSSVIDMILATDMTKHFEHLSKFVHICKSIRTPDDSLSTKSSTSSDTILTSVESKKQIKRMIVKCADVSNPARPLPISIEWAERIAEEYFRQADEERQKKMPVMMPHFERGTCSIPHSQAKFIEVFLLSMFESWNSFVDLPQVCDLLQENYRHWLEVHKNEKSAEPPSSNSAAS